jgi:hypothetical protein
MYVLFTSLARLIALSAGADFYLLTHFCKALFSNLLVTGDIFLTEAHCQASMVLAKTNNSWADQDPRVPGPDLPARPGNP